MGASGSGAPLSGSSKRNMEEKESKANVSTHPKYSGSKDLHYIGNIFKGGLYMWTGLQKCQNRGESLVLSKTSIFSIFIGLAALDKCRLAYCKVVVVSSNSLAQRSVL